MSRLQTNRPRQAVVLFLVLCAVVTMKQSIYTGNVRDSAPDTGEKVMKNAKQQQNRQGGTEKETAECLVGDFLFVGTKDEKKKKLAPHYTPLKLLLPCLLFSLSLSRS